MHCNLCVLQRAYKEAQEMLRVFVNFRSCVPVQQRNAETPCSRDPEAVEELREHAEEALADEGGR